MRAHRAARAAVTIEGEAVVLERRPGVPLPRNGEPQPATNDNEPGVPTWTRRREARPDLVFPGAVRWPTKPRKGATGPDPVRFGRLGATGLVAAALLLGASLVAGRIGDRMPSMPRPAAGFELDETRSELALNRDRPVLVVEGRIRNLSGRIGTAPPVSIRMGGENGFRRSFRPSAAVLQPGAALFFHSTLALPSATSGTVAVSLERAAEGVSMSQ